MLGRTFEDKRWRARSDAECLAEALEIQKDPERIRMAKAAAQELVKERKETLKQRERELVQLERLVDKRGTQNLVVPRDKDYPSDFPIDIKTPTTFNRNVE